jgi:carbonic anhydrase
MCGDCGDIAGHQISLPRRRALELAAAFAAGAKLAVQQNVILNVEKLKKATPIISKFVEAKKIRIVGAIYNLDSGWVELTGDA